MKTVYNNLPETTRNAIHSACVVVVGFALGSLAVLILMDALAA
jgi:hypothetical protein